MRSSAAMPVTPLDATAEAALKAVLAESQGRYRLAADTSEALVTYFKARGRGVMDLPWDVDRLNDAAWEREWRAYLRAAGVTDEAEALLLIEWLRARSAPGSTTSSQQGITKVALTALENNGYKISPAAAAALERELSASEAGSEESQCCNARLAFRLLMNVDPTPQQTAWWEQQFSALASLDGGAGIDIPGLEAYNKLHKPSSSAVQLLTLERALKNERDFNEWLMQTVRSLEVVGLPKASIRLMMVVSQATTQANGMWEPKRTYLMGYFFKEYRGLGLPKLLGHSSAYNSMGAFAAAHAKGPATPSSSGFLPPGLGRLDGAGSEASFSVDMASLSGRSAGPLSEVGSQPSVCPSASTASFDTGALAAAITAAVVPAVKAALASEKGSDQAGGGGGGGGKRCPYCRRTTCPMLEDSSKQCRAASEALQLLRLKNKEKPEDDTSKKGE